ncbi:MBL fold metallo-hydrolase [Empedobacter falsenii]|uniref:MBL fold metallo-hydrolase n=1 Tax=Empedobacter falsenii TaxID=343874 RepID=A0A7H9DWE1_9FLAO|nr:MBL fold metallo-hydrolase [Empedobacter falsenii]QLL59504.1 MBL fold metallo-hydrolase [Empedobacter falsenii]
MAKSNIKIHFLGTGTSQGIPIIGSDHPVCLSTNQKDKRLRSSLLLEKDGKVVTIDSGPDFRQQMLRYNAQRLDGILYTHEHNDHVLGLDDIRPLVFKSGEDMNVYGLKRVLDEIHNRFPYMFAEHKYPGVPTVIENEVETEQFSVAGFNIQPIKVMHGSLPILGYLIDDKIAYLTDVKTVPAESLEKLRGVEILIISALRVEQEHFSHILLDEAIRYSELIGAKSTYFTHISHHLGFHDEVDKGLPKGKHLAYDMLEINL